MSSEIHSVDTTSPPSEFSTTTTTHHAAASEDWHPDVMNEEFLLTPTDVAEALGRPVSTVMEIISTGRLPAYYARGWKITHRDLARFIANHQAEAIALGAEPQVDASFVASRPVDDDVVNR